MNLHRLTIRNRCRQIFLVEEAANVLLGISIPDSKSLLRYRPIFATTSPLLQSGKLCSSSVAVHSCKWRNVLPFSSPRDFLRFHDVDPDFFPFHELRNRRNWFAKSVHLETVTFDFGNFGNRHAAIDSSRIITWSSRTTSRDGIGDAKLLAHFQRNARRKVFSTKLSRNHFYTLWSRNFACSVSRKYHKMSINSIC